MSRLIGLILLLAGMPATAQDTTAGVTALPICYNFGCSIRDVINIPADDWQTVSAWFNPPAADAGEEREKIRQAVGWMEVIVGRHTPTHLDKARNDLVPSDSAGQMDCIDESLNTTTYLLLFERSGFLRWHRVLDRAYRRAILDQHWAGQIEDKKTGRRYVVDSWFADNGRLPFVQATSEWEKIRYFGTSFDWTF